MSENRLKKFLNENYGYIRTRDFEKSKELAKESGLTQWQSLANN